MSDRMRLPKYLSRSGVASRRASEELIAEGRVRVDGERADRPSLQVDPGESVVEVDGERVELSPPLWLALHKPPRVVVSRGDPQGRKTVYDLIPDGPPQELFHVGRLDYLSEGLLMLTNQGDVAHRLMHPRWEVEKRYEVAVDPSTDRSVIQALVEGVELEDGPARADAASLLPPASGDGPSILLLTLHEGRNREIRRMLDRLGVRIHSLRRLSFGPVELGELTPGEWRELGRSERRRLRRRVELPDSALEPED